MPVTAKLSRQFYERLGEDVANELVEWFNAVDATYRADLTHLNEVNFQRFDAKLEQRLAQSDAKLEQRFSEVKTDIMRLEERMDRRFDAIIQQQQTALAELRAELVKWMFLFWVGTLGTLIALLKFWG